MINIVIKPTTKLNNVLNANSAYISFIYNPSIVEYIKALPAFNRAYSVSDKCWEVSIDKVAEFCNHFIDFDIEIIEKIAEKENITDSIIELPKNFKYKTKPFAHQEDGVRFALAKERFLLTDMMGCLTGDTLIKVNRGGASHEITLKELYRKFNRPVEKVRSGENKWKIRSLLNDHFGLNDILSVVYTGKKEVYKMTLESGKSLNATADHKILTDKGYTALEHLHVNDTVLTNGTMVCPVCGTSENLCLSNKKHKFYGYCRKCMYDNRNGVKAVGNEILKHKGNDGYIYLTGKPLRKHHRKSSSGVLEHVYIMENIIGRKITRDEQIHHINGVRDDNRPENLQLVTKKEHHLIHNKTSHFYKNFYKNDKEVVMIPKQDKIKSIEYVGIDDVYDISCKAPHHNYIANGIVVHNCGKTKQMIDWACCLKADNKIKRALIICGVNSLKYNWQNEIATHSNEKSWVLGTRYRKNGNQYEGSSQDKLDDLNNLPNSAFIITNIETMRAKAYKEKNRYKFPVSEKIQDLISNGEINCIIFDEVHKSSNPTSLQSRATSKVRCDYMAALTGTPIMNKVIDLYFPLNWLGYETHSFYNFKNHYCVLGGFGGSEIMGYKNLDEIRKMLDKIMLRRTKEDVLDLPEKIYIDEYVEMKPKQAKLYNEVLNGIKSELHKISFSENPLAMLIKLRQATGHTSILTDKLSESAKMDRMIELVEEITNNNEKVIIFSNWQQMTSIAKELLSVYKPAYITGSINTNDRMKEVKRFQEDDNCKIIIGTVGALGTGLTLTAATNVIFLDEPWTASAKNQAIDRAHRIGTKSNVNIITLLTVGTIDSKIHDIVYKKGLLSDIMIDGKMGKIDMKIINELIS